MPAASSAGTTALETTFNDNYTTNLANLYAWWEPFTTLVEGTGVTDTTYTRGLLVIDAGGLSPQVDDPTPSNITAASASVTATVYEKLYTLTEKDVRDNPFKADQLAQKAPQEAWNTLGASLRSIMTSATTTAHPLNGEALISAQGGGTLYISDAYTWNHPDGSTTNQSNTSTAALSLANVRTDINTMWSYVGPDGETVANFDGKPWLIGPIDLLGTLDLVKADFGVEYDGSSLETAVAGHLMGCTMLPGNATDANDWLTLRTHAVTEEDGTMRNVAPFQPWVRSLPSSRVTLNGASGHWHFYNSFEYATLVDPSVSTNFIQHAVT